MKYRSLLLSVLLLATVSGVAQTSFKYKRAIADIAQEGWYAVNLPPEIFSDLNEDLGDMRIFSLGNGDTLEIPYLLDVQVDVVSHKDVLLPMFNKSYRDGLLYLTFEQKPGQKVNRLELKFVEDNYFAWVTLEGSDDGSEWFQITSGQRIVCVENSNGPYRLSELRFPVAAYRYLRAQLRADVPLTFERASFKHTEVEAGNFSEYPVNWSSRVEKRSRQSVVELVLDHEVPVSSVEVMTDTSADYYRPLRIEYPADSFKTDRGWMMRYETLFQGHLTSFRPNKFEFPWKKMRALRLVVANDDNQPIGITGVKVTGPRTRILARLEPGTHFMLYGSSAIRAPHYDLAYFKSKIPDAVLTARLEPAEALTPPPEGATPLFQNEIWLWTIIIVMIAGLGLFTIKMMSEKRHARV